jgi:ABC-type uncharacterized transport system fused permease/ATPase subunit
MEPCGLLLQFFGMGVVTKRLVLRLSLSPRFLSEFFSLRFRNALTKNDFVDDYFWDCVLDL